MQMAQQMAAAGGDGVDPSIQLMLDLMRQDREQEEAQQNAEALVDGDGDGEGGVDPDAMTYEQLLALGEQIGDVGEERWRVEGVATVAALEVVAWHAGEGRFAQDRSDCEKCLVCQCEYEEGEMRPGEWIPPPAQKIKKKNWHCWRGFHGDFDGFLMFHR